MDKFKSDAFKIDNGDLDITAEVVIKSGMRLLIELMGKTKLRDMLKITHKFCAQLNYIPENIYYLISIYNEQAFENTILQTILLRNNNSLFQCQRILESLYTFIVRQLQENSMLLLLKASLEDANLINDICEDIKLKINYLENTFFEFNDNNIFMFYMIDYIIPNIDTYEFLTKYHNPKEIQDIKIRAEKFNECIENKFEIKRRSQLKKGDIVQYDNSLYIVHSIVSSFIKMNIIRDRFKLQENIYYLNRNKISNGESPNRFISKRRRNKDEIEINVLSKLSQYILYNNIEYTNKKTTINFYTYY